MNYSRRRSQGGPNERAAVLVIGGAGYIGSHVSKCLWHAGFQPVVFDNLSSGTAEAVRWGPLFEGNCIDAVSIESALAHHRSSVVVYCCGPRLQGHSPSAAGRYADTGLAYMHSVLNAMHAARAQALICLSTYHVYGTPAALPVREENTPAPLTRWGKLARQVETLTALATMDSTVRYVTLRVADVCGADADGELHEPADDWHFIAKAAQVAAGENGIVELHGDLHATHDGTLVRDYVNVVDVGHAVVRAALYLLCGGNNAVVNIGSGSGYSELQILQMLRDLSARDVGTRVVACDDQPPLLIADISRAASLLHWTPSNSTTDQLVRVAWEAAVAGTTVHHVKAP